MSIQHYGQSLVTLGQITVIASLLSACSNYPSYPVIKDSAPGHHVDISKVTDAVPKPEQRSPYGNPDSYEVYGKRYHILDQSEGYIERGTASWYGTKFHGRRTSSGETYNMYAMTAAHKTLPIPSYARVTHLQSGESIIVKINDRGPFVNNRLIDLSYVAARKLGIAANGTGPVEVKVITPTDLPKTTEIAAAPQRVTPLANKLVAAKPAATPPTGKLYLQVGLFKDRSNAEQMRQNLMQLPIPGIHVATDRSQTKPLYRVRIGPLSEDSEAEQLIETLANKGHKGFRIRVD